MKLDFICLECSHEKSGGKKSMHDERKATGTTNKLVIENLPNFGRKKVERVKVMR